MNPDPLTVIEPGPDDEHAEWFRQGWMSRDAQEAPDLPRRRDTRIVLAAFAGMGILAVLAWAVQR
jgi:hypothetical protein